MSKRAVEEKDDAEYEERIADPIVSAIGNLGRWQLKICLLLFLIKLPLGWHLFALVFLAAPVEIECSEPNGIDKCSSDCHKINYNRTVFNETIITEFGLICDYKFLPKTTQFIFGCGIIIGNGLFGILSDKLGRKPILQVCIIIILIFGISTSVIPWFWSFCVMRFLVALGVSGSSLISFVMILELVGPQKRSLMSILQYLPINIAHLSLSGFGYYLRNWRNFQFAISIPSLIFITYYWLIPESPRWLLSHWQFDKAAIILEKGARANKMPTDHIRNDIIASRRIRPSYVGQEIKIKKAPTILDLFRYHYLRIKTICMCFNCFVCGLSFIGISQYIAGMSGNIFLNVTIAGFFGVPGTLVAIPMTKYCGRKKTLIIANILAGLNMITIAFIPHTSQFVIVLTTMCYFWTTVTIPNVFLYWGELLPTVLRNTGLGLGNTCQIIGAMLASIVSLTAFIESWLPPAIIGTLILIGAILGFLLPETIGRILPESIYESENIYVKIFCY